METNFVHDNRRISMRPWICQFCCAYNYGGYRINIFYEDYPDSAQHVTFQFKCHKCKRTNSRFEHLLN